MLQYRETGKLGGLFMQKMLAILLLTLLVLTASSCAARNTKSIETEPKLSKSVNLASSANGLAENTGQSGAAGFSSAADSLQQKAAQLGSTPGRVALAMIIHKLDSTENVDDLAKKSANELFSIIEITAPQKSQTLEGLDRLYELSSILASENIFVQIQANDVVSSAPTSQNKNWVSKFETAINSNS